MSETARWLGFYVSLAVCFGLAVGLVWTWKHSGEYFAGFITEESLSFDNMFVFLMIMSRFAVPRDEQSKVLLIGIAIALALRACLIVAGAAAIAAFSWIFFLFGAFLLYTAVTFVVGKTPAPDVVPSEPWLVRLVRRVVPTTGDYHGDRLTVLIDGRRQVTPMLLVMVAIGSVDVLFALDSIPAIFGLTKEAYIVFMANAFALMGLRQLYFLLDGLLRRLVYLHIGLAIILGFIGAKLILEALHANELPFINGGHGVEWAPEIPIPASLGVILGTLVVVSIASLAKTRRDAADSQAGDEAKAP
jgi:tellurite resistance protein TerC